jgi:hypothetical protein
VQVLPRVIEGGSSDLILGGLLLTDNPIISSASLVLSFPSEKSVGEYFGLDSPEHAAALIYFTGYQGKPSAPRSFLVARRIAQNVPAYLRGSRYQGSLADLTAVSNGTLSININGAALSLSGIDLSGASSLSAAAALLQSELAGELSGVTVTYSSLTQAFTITSPAAGEASLVSPAGDTPLAKLLGLRSQDSPVISPGMAGLSPSEQMAAIVAKTQNFVSFTTAWEAPAEEMLQWAAWAGSHYGWLYVPYTTNPAALSPDSVSDPASLLRASGYDHTAMVYGSLEYAAFIMGIAASVAWNRVNGTITAAFKRTPGLAATVTDESAAAILEAKRCNYLGNFATRNAEFVFLYPGCLSASDYGFIDPYLNSVWLNNRLQLALLDGLTAVGRVPYNQRGYTMIKAWMMDPVKEALNNAAIEAGVVLSERQKSEVMNEAGLDISGDLMTAGYYIQVLDPGAPARAQRESPVISLWYTYGGAVQKIDVASTAVL